MTECRLPEAPSAFLPALACRVLYLMLRWQARMDASLFALMRQFEKGRSHMALVIDAVHLCSGWARACLLWKLKDLGDHIGTLK
jgi:hypothetical protein